MQCLVLPAYRLTPNTAYSLICILVFSRPQAPITKLTLRKRNYKKRPTKRIKRDIFQFLYSSILHEVGNRRHYAEAKQKKYLWRGSIASLLICLSFVLFLPLSSVSLCLFFSLCLLIWVAVYPTVRLCVCVSHCLHLSSLICLSVCLSVSVSLCLPACLHVCFFFYFFFYTIDKLTSLYITNQHPNLVLIICIYFHLHFLKLNDSISSCQRG